MRWKILFGAGMVFVSTFTVVYLMSAGVPPWGAALKTSVLELMARLPRSPAPVENAEDRPLAHTALVPIEATDAALFARGHALCQGLSGCHVQFHAATAAVPGTEAGTGVELGPLIATYRINRYTGEETLLRVESATVLRRPPPPPSPQAMPWEGDP